MQSALTAISGAGTKAGGWRAEDEKVTDRGKSKTFYTKPQQEQEQKQ